MKTKCDFCEGREMYEAETIKYKDCKEYVDVNLNYNDRMNNLKINYNFCLNCYYKVMEKIPDIFKD